MRVVLGLWLLAVACSSSTSGNGTSEAEAGRAGQPESAGGQEAQGGDKPVGGAAAHGGAPSASGAPAGAGGGVSSSAGATSAGTGGDGDAAAGGDAGGEGGSAEVTPAGGSGAGGGAGGMPVAGTSGAAGSGPDACKGVAHWSETERWTDYSANDKRVFAGVLWRCQVPDLCPTYPGHSASAGWFKVENCAGGPTNETAPCQCAVGACCDGCYLRPRSYLCGEFEKTAQCLGKTVNQCGGGTDSIDHDFWNLFCNGDQAEKCTRWGAHTKFTNGACPFGTGCLEQGDQASCVDCN